MEIKKKYNEYAKKHKLPDFEELNHAFEVCTIENEDFLLREVRRKMNEKIDVYIELLNGVLNPETDIICMHECSVFTEDEKALVYNVYKKLLFLSRMNIEASIDEDEKKSVNFINYAWKEWNDIKKDLASFITRLKESWLKDSDMKEEFKYLG